jgi:hypothetical protein
MDRRDPSQPGDGSQAADGYLRDLYGSGAPLGAGPALSSPVENPGRVLRVRVVSLAAALVTLVLGLMLLGPPTRTDRGALWTVLVPVSFFVGWVVALCGRRRSRALGPAARADAEAAVDALSTGLLLVVVLAALVVALPIVLVFLVLVHVAVFS